MAIRGKVKNVKTDPTTMRTTGTVTDTTTRTDYPFEQAFGELMGIVNEMIVQFDTVVSAGVTYGTLLDPSERGTIKSITRDSGIITDRLGNPIEFEQPFATDLGIAVNSSVRYSVVNVGGKLKATNLRLIPNP